MGNSPRYVGFLDPPYNVTLTDDSGAAVNLTGCTSNSFTLTMLNQNTGLSQQGVGVWTITDAVNGKASYQWTNADMATAGPWWIYSTVKLPAEPSPREFDPELILILPGTVGAGAAPPGVLPAPIAAALYINVRDYGARGDGVTDDTAAIQAAINALTPCDVYDGANNLVSGKTGVIFLPPGVYKISSLLTLPAGSITIQGSGMSSWIPIQNILPYENLGGTAIVTSDYADGLLNVPQDAHVVPATALYIRDLDLRTVSPAVAQTTSTPAILRLTGWLSGEISNVNVLEVKTTGGIGTNLYKIVDCNPGASKDTTMLWNMRAFGGNIPMFFAGAHLIAIGITAGQCTASIASWANAIDIQFDLGCYFADLHPFAAPYGLSISISSANAYQTCVLYGAMFESCTHYIRQDFGGDIGLLVIENPCWNSPVDPLTDIPASLSSLKVLTKYEQDETGSNVSKHITVAASSQTAGASPYTLTKQPYDQIAVVTTVGGMTALTLDGQALFNGSFSVGQQIFVGAGHTLIATWATTAPVFRLLPQ